MNGIISRKVAGSFEIIRQPLSSTEFLRQWRHCMTLYRRLASSGRSRRRFISRRHHRRRASAGQLSIGNAPRQRTPSNTSRAFFNDARRAEAALRICRRRLTVPPRRRGHERATRAKCPSTRCAKAIFSSYADISCISTLARRCHLHRRWIYLYV